MVVLLLGVWFMLIEALGWWGVEMNERVFGLIEGWDCCWVLGAGENPPLFKIDLEGLYMVDMSLLIGGDDVFWNAIKLLMLVLLLLLLLWALLLLLLMLLGCQRPLCLPVRPWMRRCLSAAQFSCCFFAMRLAALLWVFCCA